MPVTSTFTERERYLATLQFQTPDKIPMMTMGPRESTLAAWHAQGLAPGNDWFQALCRAIGVEYGFAQQPYAYHGVNFQMMPTFEEKVLEHRDGHYLVQDWMGNITEISDRYDVTYIRSAKDFVTRKWHAFPVTTPADFAAMQRRYNPDEPDRFPADFHERCAVLRQRDYPSVIRIPGPFWQLREWCGFEPLCMLCAEEPEFVEAMVQFWSDYVVAVLERLFAHHVPDSLGINEDMAYKEKSMISPAMTRRFLMPVWTRWAKLAREAGVPLVDIDSDGRVDELIPLWMESGINVCDPLEVAAGCDVVNYRWRFGRRIAYTGGIDKRCIAQGGDALEREMARIAPVVRDGGYIPGCDHGIPPDVSWSNMLHFGRLWAEMTGWL